MKRKKTVGNLQVMRITGGKYVRRQIACPPGIIRPAMDMMRESMFSILGDIEGVPFLDLFSGSGCVAIEAASRGASPIHLVEMDRGKKMVEILQILDQNAGLRCFFWIKVAKIILLK